MDLKKEHISMADLGRVTIAAVIFSLVFFAVLLCCLPSHACSRDPQTLRPDVRQKYESLVREADKVGVSFILTCAERSQAEQDNLYAQGRTVPGKIVTWRKSSKHGLGLAFDVAVKHNGVITWDPAKYRILGKLAAKVGLVWGGNWKERDYAHFEVEG